MRAITTTLLASLALTLCAAVLKQDPEPSKTGRPVDIFAELDGKWAGTFVGYNVRGTELYRIKVEQQYETINATTQKVTVRDTMPDGTLISGEGENTAVTGEDGVIRLACVVRKSNGERVEHDGRLARGPLGKQQLVWFSVAEKREETFREWVEGEGKHAVYHIQGMGRYGDTSIMMVGRYARQP